MSAYKPAYKKLTKKADFGRTQSASFGNTAEAIRQDTIKEMKSGKTSITGQIGIKKPHYF